MKKTYTAPLTEVVKVNAEQMICQSPVNNVDGLAGVTKGGTWAGGTVDDKDFDGEVTDELW